MTNHRAVRYIQSQIKRCGVYRDVFNHINPIITDVSLRDGIQGLTPEELPTEKKQKIFEYIYNLKFANNIEIGSVVSDKHMPIMKDVIALYQSSIHYIESNEPMYELRMAAEQEIDTYDPKLFALVPNLKKLKIATQHNMTNFAFLTSVSERFQKMNLNQTLEEHNAELYKMGEYLYYNKRFYTKQMNTKLYISCINHCPIDGKMDTDAIVGHIVNHACTEYYNEICLSDTCGSLSYQSYKIILDECLNYVNPDMISLHLHVTKNNNIEVENIIRHSLNQGVHRFDVSLMDYGGCTMTMNQEDRHSNLNYTLLCNILDKYISENVDILKRIQDI